MQTDIQANNDFERGERVLRQIRRIWQETGGANLDLTHGDPQELRLYYTETLLNMLLELAELEDLAESQLTGDPLTKFSAIRSLLCSQARLLTDVGLLLFKQK
jgi:hypothetical protein